MTVTSGTRLGPYEIVAPLGAGGMGEVFKARDTRLERSVAIKMLPAGFAQNAHLKLRFEREAKTISQLNHPNICTLYDIGSDNGTDYLVMELIDGESLADRIAKGPLPLAEVLRYGAEIATALDRAHKAGIIHRDLKPGNVMLTKSGAKLLDFGLAKTAMSAKGPSIFSNTAAVSPTEQKPLTEEGTVVGTFQYMAPEQLEGTDADARTDIFALGAVLYEMATGRRAFQGKNKTSLIAAIIDREPTPISQLQPLTPPAFERLVSTCLAKDPEDRWQTAHDVWLQLKWIAEAGSGAGVAAPVVHRRRIRERVIAALALVAVSAAAAMTIEYLRLRNAPLLPSQLSINLPAKMVLALNGENCGSLMISPDGRKVTFAAKGADGKVMLYVRPMDGAVQPIPGTENGTFPFWSPDSRAIAFFSEGKLKRVDLGGAPPLTICDAPNNPRSGSWNKDGTIIFSPVSLGEINKVSASGGKPVPVTRIDKATGETTHRWATFLPDGRHFLFMAGTHRAGTRSETNAIFVGSIDSPMRKLLVRARSNAVYSSGYLLYVRDRILIAQPFDLDKLQLTGDAIPIVQNVQYETAYFRAAFDVSDTGTLVYHSSAGSDVSQIRLLDRSGKQLETIGEPAQYDAGTGLGSEINLSPDGHRIAAAITDPGSGITSIWIHDLARKVRTRFTFGNVDQGSPRWSPDGTRIAYSSAVVGGATDLCVKDVSGNAPEQVLLHDENVKLPLSWSPDGRYLAYEFTDFRSKSKTSIMILPVTGDRKPFPFAAASGNEAAAAFSPDGHWLAYTSDESGRPEVYIAAFPGPGAKWQISTNGGSDAHWRRDGGEIIYQDLESKLVSVPINISGSSANIGTPSPLFDVINAMTADMSADHTRFFVASPQDAQADPSITVVTNWPATLKK